MTGVINNMDLPCDVKGVIKSFYCDNMGYTYEQNEYIKKEKKKNKPKNMRIKVELNYFKETGCAVGWLKKTSTNRCGAYTSMSHELKQILNSRIDSIISLQDTIDILLHMYRDYNIPYRYKSGINELLSIQLSRYAESIK